VIGTPDVADRRSKLLSLTDAGTRHLEDLAVRIGAERRRFFAALTDHEYRTLSRLLAKIYDAHTTEDQWGSSTSSVVRVSATRCSA
jgi:hypothetical protein